ncbi:MAG TPA: PQQ-dependent sugar dehydrogenase, partial [Roseiflexaceae bacterium]
MQPHISTHRWPAQGGYQACALILFLALMLLLGVTLPMAGTAAAASPLPNFQVSAVFTGLKNPTDFQFADDGRVFVAEKAGLIKVFNNLADPTPDVFADLQTNVYKGPNDHGILGLALDPQFTTTRPYVYALYTYDAPIGGTAPRWNDVCPDPPGANKNGCVVSGRLSRLQANGNQMTDNEQVLIEAWCQQFTSHSIGALAFGADGALYASAGEGANTSSGDYGQVGYSNLITYTTITPVNPCGDPPTGVGGIQTRPTARGGALRAQSLRRPAGEPALLSGTIIRVNPDTGAGLPDNPLAGSADANARRIAAYGLRNPFRFAMRPGTNEIWIGDVGWGAWEEINRIPNPTGSAPLNFGWPCYEGTGRQTAYDGMNLDMCEQL